MQNEDKNVMCLLIPGNPCCTAAVWQGGGGSGEDDREMASLYVAAYPALQTLTHQLESTNLGSRLLSDYLCMYILPPL